MLKLKKLVETYVGLILLRKLLLSASVENRFVSYYYNSFFSVVRYNKRKLLSEQNQSTHLQSYLIVCNSFFFFSFLSCSFSSRYKQNYHLVLKR